MLTCLFADQIYPKEAAKNGDDENGNSSKAESKPVDDELEAELRALRFLFGFLLTIYDSSCPTPVKRFDAGNRHLRSQKCKEARGKRNQKTPKVRKACRIPT